MKKRVTISLSQHVILMLGLLIITALGLYLYFRKSVGPKLQEINKSIVDNQGRVDFLKRELNTFKKPDLESARQALLDAESRLRAIKIEGNPISGRYISNRPASEVNSFLSEISALVVRCGLKLQTHRGLTSTDSQLKEFIIRELKIEGNFSSLCAFVSSLEKLAYRVLVLRTELKTTETGTLAVKIVISI